MSASPPPRSPSPGRMHAVTDETREVVESVLAYCRARALYEAIPLDLPATPAALAREASGTITTSGIGAAQALRVFGDTLAPACLSTDHPGYLSFIPSAPSKAAAAFDLVVAASSIYGGSWLEGAGAVFAENEVLAWLAAEFGLPQGAGGVFVQGGTIGNLSALVAARESARAHLLERGEALPARWAVVCSEESHSSVAGAASVMDVDVVAVPVGADGRLHGEQVAQALDRLGAAAIAVVATAGTTNLGVVDHLASIATVTSARGTWLHVDGAYGLVGMLVPELRGLYEGVQYADSVIVDPHKWLFAPFDACALLYRDPAIARSAHTQHASYLDTLEDAPAANPSDLAVHLTRRARGLPLWFSLATYGTDEYRSAIRAGVSLAHRIADEIERRPGLSLVRRPELSVVAFRRMGWSAADYAAWSTELLARQLAFVVPSSDHGEPMLRFAIINPLTTFELLCDVLDSLEDAASAAPAEGGERATWKR